MAKKSRPKPWTALCNCAPQTFVFHGLLVLSTVVLTFGSSSPAFSEFHFTVEPRAVVVERDRAALLDCAAHHQGGGVSIQWLRDEEQLKEDSRRYTFDNGSLYFTHVVHSRSHKPDEGTYQCVATVSNFGSIVSSKAKLTVAYLDKSLIAKPQDLSVHLEDTAMFACDMRGAPKPIVRWFKQELELNTQGVSYQLHMDGVLEIPSVSFQDFGRYKCRVDNGDDSFTSEFAELRQDSDINTYRGLPRFIMTPKNKIALEGTTVMLYCAANGRDREDQKPTMSWLKDGTTIDLTNLDSRLSVVGSGSLRIDALQSTDSGSYTCRATNSIDSVDAVTTLTIHVAPRFQQRPRNIFAKINTDTELVCQASGIPSPRIKWMKNRDIINPSDYFHIVDGHNLRILGLVQSDAGMYQCFAENEVGSVQASAQLGIVEQEDARSPSPMPFTTHPLAPHTGTHSANQLELASQPRNLAAAIVNTRFITLSWEPPEQSGTTDITNYGVYWKEIGSQRERVLNTTKLGANVQHLKPAADYEFRVMAYNTAGPSRSAALLTVTTHAEVTVPASPRHMRAHAQSPTSIQVMWEPPASTTGGITNYKLYYYEAGAKAEEDINVMETRYMLSELEEDRLYTFRVVAFNSNGAGVSSDEVMAKTYADVPSDPPQNVSVETISSSSLVIRWEPPEDDHQNGVITGYKIRYRERRGTGADTITTDGNLRAHAVDELKRDTEYQVRVLAVNGNGTSPPSPWVLAKTYHTDLDESVVPGQPGSLHVRAMTDSILVSWTPPREQDIMIRGYILGYGIGIPDVYRQYLEDNERYYTIKNLKPSSEYVISLRSYNHIGEGRPVYETTITREITTPEPQTPMSTPLGLKAQVLSATTVVLTWTDSTLGRNQRVMDNRYYTIRYNPKMSRKHRYVNATDLNAHINDLRPNMEYEFAVKVTKGRRESGWSMSTFEATAEAAPGTAPRDLTPVAVEGRPTWVMLNWQPPRQPNGIVSGYMIFYTTDATQMDKYWVVSAVNGDELSHTIPDLTPETTYYFKVQARNSQGYGPTSPTVVFQTPKLDGTGGGQIEIPDDYNKPPYSVDNSHGLTRDHYPFPDFEDEQLQTKLDKDDKKDGIQPLVIWIIIGCVGGVSVIAVVVVVIIVCKRRMSDGDRKARKGPGYMPANKAGPKDLKPPDLWIHTDGMELKNIEKSNQDSGMGSPMQRDAQDTKSMSEGSTGMPMDARRNSFISERNYDPHRPEDRYQNHRNPIRPKPSIMIPVDQPPPPREPIATAIPNGHLAMSDNTIIAPTPIRPVYPRTQYNAPQYTSTPRVNAGDVSQGSSVVFPLVIPDILPTEEHMTSTLERRKARGERMRKQSNSNPRLTGSQSPDSPTYVNAPGPIPYDQLSQCSPTLLGVTAAQSDAAKCKSLPHHPVLHPLRSFSVPGPPLQGALATPTPKHIVRPQPQQPQPQSPQPISPPPQPGSPYKKPNPPVSSTPSIMKSRSPMPVVAPRAPDVTIKSSGSADESTLPKSISTEELTAEMANLEGLMKDLNAITQQEFEC